MTETLLLAKSIAIAAWFAIYAAAERIAPAAARPAGSDARRLPRNLGLWLINTVMSPLVIVPISAGAASLALWTRPAAPFWAGLALDIVALDLWLYFWHRANHEWPFLWRFHQIHHRDEFLDATSAVRFHFGEVFLSALARGALIAALAIPLSSIIIFDALILVATIFHHSNVKLPARLEGALRALIVTPSHHWVHHHAVRADTDSNYATLLTVWDRLFGSWSLTARTPAMRIGAEGAQDLSLPNLIARPFSLRSVRTVEPPPP